MQKTLLDLNFDYWAIFLLFIIPAIIDLSIFIYVFFFLPQNRTNKVFAAFVFLLGIAQALDGIMRLSATAETAAEWSKISAAPWVFITSFGLLFSLRYSGWHLKFSSNLLIVLLFFPTIVLEFMIIADLNEVTIQRSEIWHWIANPKPSATTSIIYLWNSIIAFITLILFWLYYIQVRKDKSKNRFSLIIAVGNTIPFIVGITAEVIFPLFFGINNFPVSTISIIIFSLSILIAITKYRALDYSPKHQWKNILDTMNDGVLIVDTQDQIMYANKAFCAQVGFGYEELKGQIARNVLTDELDTRKKIEEIILERAEEKSSQFEVLLKTKNGKKIWTLISESPYLDAKGNVIGSIGIHTNIDDLKLANNELKLFIYKASHDLRSPIAAILGLTDLATSENDKEQIKNYLKMIDYSAKKLDATLINLVKNMQIKDINKFNEKINIEEVLEKVLKQFIGYEGFQQLEISKSILFNGDFLSNRLIIESIFQNIIENAIKYRKTNTSNSWLQISVQLIEKNIQIIFSDNGIGIDSSVKNRIFEMYFRGTENSKGSGLGLYLVNTGIDKLGGTIEVDSEKDQGTIIIITIPLFVRV